MDLTTDGQAVDGTRTFIDGSTLTFRATNIRKERTGIHARFSIIWGTTVMAYSTFNIERDEERTRIVNAAYRRLGDQVSEKGPYQNPDLKHDADIFSLRVWPTFVDSQQAEEMAGDPTSTPAEYLAHPHIVQGGGTILFAPPGKGKSYTGMLMVVAVDSGTNSIWPIKQTKSLYVNLERSAESVKRRLGTVNTVLGLDPDRTLLTLNARGRSLADVRDAIEKAVKEREVEFVMLDSLSRAGMGDLTENRPANNIADVLNSLAPTWAGIAHSPRKDDTHVYGSIFFDAAADIVVRLQSQATSTGLGIKLEVVKVNDGAQPPPKYLSYEFDEYGINGVEVAKAEDFIELLPETSSHADEIEAYLDSLDTRRDSATHIGNVLHKDRTLVQKIMNGDDRFAKVGRRGREVDYGLVNPHV